METAGIKGLPQDWQYRLRAGFGVLQLLQIIMGWFILNSISLNWCYFLMRGFVGFFCPAAGVWCI